MLLRASGEQTDKTYDLNSVTSENLDSGVEHGDWLRKLTEATIRGDWLTVGEVRPQAEVEMGTQKVVDALTVASAFNGITRVADATGIPLDSTTAEATTEMRDTTGIQQFDYGAKTERYG